MLDILIVVLVLLAIGDFFADRKTIETLRSRLTDYWIFVQELPFRDELAAHVGRIRRLLARKYWVILSYVALFFFGLSLLSGALAYYEAWTSPSAFLHRFDASEFALNSVRNYATITIRRDLSEAFLNDQAEDDEIDDLIYFSYLDIDESNPFGLPGTECEDDPKAMHCINLAEKIGKIRSERDALIEKIATFKTNDRDLAVYLARYDLYLLLLHAAIYVIALAVSMGVTIFLLKKMERIRIGSLLFLLIDVALAVAIPLFALMTLLLVLLPSMALGGIQFYGPITLAELARRIAWSFASYSIIFDSMTVVAFRNFALIYLQWDFSDDHIKGLQLWLSLPIDWAKYQLFDFVRDIRRALVWNVREIGPVATERNWMLGVSISYSLIYIVAVGFLILTTRYKIARQLVSRILQRLVEHQKGPIAAVSVILSAVLVVVKFYKG